MQLSQWAEPQQTEHCTNLQIELISSFQNVLERLSCRTSTYRQKNSHHIIHLCICAKSSKKYHNQLLVRNPQMKQADDVHM